MFFLLTSHLFHIVLVAGAIVNVVEEPVFNFGVVFPGRGVINWRSMVWFLLGLWAICSWLSLVFWGVHFD
jgi:hypothetical protein